MFRPAAPPAARQAPVVRPVAAPVTAATSTGAAGALAGALAAAMKAGIVGGLVGLALAIGGLPLPTAPMALVLAIVLVLAIGCWIDDRRGGGRRGLTAALIALVPTWITFPELYAAAAPLPPPLALGITAAVATLVPSFAFSYLRATPRPGARRWSFSAGRFAAGMAGMALLVACQVAAVAGLDLPQADDPRADRPALPHAVVAAVDRAKQSIADVVERVRRSVPPGTPDAE